MGFRKSERDLESQSLLYITVVAFFLLLVFGCTDTVSESPEEPDETVLARVGEKTISVNEFIRRAEYTMRPEYCMRDNYIHKKIVLNSLIAEKLFALEAGEVTELHSNAEFRAFLKGRKEQAMRQYLQYAEAGKDVQVDTAEIRSVYKQAGRTYRVQYINIPEERYQGDFARELRASGDLSALHRTLYGSREVPEKAVTWADASARPLHQALYGKSVKKGEILGPLRSVENMVTLLKVESWVDRKAIGDREVRERWNMVHERLHGYATAARFQSLVSEIMAGKQLDFNAETFYALVEIFAPLYLRDEEEKQSMANAVFWKKERDTEIFNSVRSSIEKYMDYPLLKIDEELWTVRDFQEAQKSHPLVFRSKQLNRKNFAGQFKLAVVDLVRDHYLTREAYSRGYDQVNIVQRDLAMWEDHMEALYHRNQYLRQAGFSGSFGTRYMQAIDEHLNPYVDQLQARYSDRISINYEVFGEIELTGIDMFATLENVPYPVAVPSFPVLTTDHWLNYGGTIEDTGGGSGTARTSFNTDGNGGTTAHNAEI